MDDLTKELQQWQVEAPSKGLEERLWREITTLPQRQSLVRRLQNSLEQLFADWHYGLGYKIAGFACCALFGFYIGMQQQPMATLSVAASASSLEITDVALARGNWMEEL